MREKITELHANVAAINDLVILIGSDGVIRSCNPVARSLLPQLESINTTQLKLSEILKPAAGTTFKTAFAEASTSPQRCSQPIRLTSVDTASPITLSGRLHRFPGSKGATLIASNISREINLKQQVVHHETQHRQLLEATPTALLVIEAASGNVAEINSTTTVE